MSRALIQLIASSVAWWSSRIDPLNARRGQSFIMWWMVWEGCPQPQSGRSAIFHLWSSSLQHPCLVRSRFNTIHSRRGSWCPGNGFPSDCIILWVSGLDFSHSDLQSARPSFSSNLYISIFLMCLDVRRRCSWRVRLFRVIRLVCMW